MSRASTRAAATTDANPNSVTPSKRTVKLPRKTDNAKKGKKHTGRQSEQQAPNTKRQNPDGSLTKLGFMAAEAAMETITIKQYVC